MLFHRRHEMRSIAMEITTPVTADRMTTASVATTVARSYSAQCPHTGRQTEAFPTTLQEKSSWHCSVLQLMCSGTPPVGKGWMLLIMACHFLQVYQRWKILCYSLCMCTCVHVWWADQYTFLKRRLIGHSTAVTQTPQMSKSTRMAQQYLDTQG